jgi:hypothetical protein
MRKPGKPNAEQRLDEPPASGCGGDTTTFALDSCPRYCALLSAKVAAQRLGITVTTLYDWLGQSDYGLLVIRGQRTTIQYFQGGPRGQGRIQIEVAEVERLLELMRVIPQKTAPRRPPVQRDQFPGIRVPLGRPSA